jgi:hypothetical protein
MRDIAPNVGAVTQTEPAVACALSLTGLAALPETPVRSHWIGFDAGPPAGAALHGDAQARRAGPLAAGAWGRSRMIERVLRGALAARALNDAVQRS